MFLIILVRFRLRGTAIVRTQHNLDLPQRGWDHTADDHVRAYRQAMSLVRRTSARRP